ncbi:unnamed protein product, partial [Heterosigma akashiwo]
RGRRRRGRCWPRRSRIRWTWTATWPRWAGSSARAARSSARPRRRCWRSTPPSSPGSRVWAHCSATWPVAAGRPPRPRPPLPLCAAAASAAPPASGGAAAADSTTPLPPSPRRCRRPLCSATSTSGMVCFAAATCPF